MTNYPLIDNPSTPIEWEPDESLYAERLEAVRLGVEKDQRSNHNFLNESLTNVCRDDQTEKVLLELFWKAFDTGAFKQKEKDKIIFGMGEELYQFLCNCLDEQVEREME